MTTNPEISHLLKSNAQPSDEQVVLLKSLVTSSQSSLADLDRQVDELEKTLAALKAERGRVQEDITLCKNALSPLRRLPTELTAHIFVLCLEGEEILIPWSRNTFPLVLCQISSRWRSIALQTTQLWSKLTLDFDYFSRGAHKGLFPQIRPIFQEWASRSSDRLMTFTCRFKRPQQRFEPHPIIDIIAKHSSRFVSISLDIHLSYYSALAKIPQGSLKNLESLSIIGPQNTREPVGLEKSDALRDLASLKRLRIDPWHDGFDLTPLNIRWRQMTHLQLGSVMDISHYLPILAQCGALESCKILVALYDDSNFHEQCKAYSSPIVLLSLHTFVLTVCSWSEVNEDRTGNEFLSLLSAPNLRKTHFISEPFADDLAWFHSAFISFSERSQFVLDELKIVMEVIAPSEIQHIIRNFSSLKHLRIESPGSLDIETILLFTETDLLPQLESLEIYIQGDHPSADALAEVLLARANHGQQTLRRVRVYHRNRIFRNIMNKWRKFGEIKLAVQYAPE